MSSGSIAELRNVDLCSAQKYAYGIPLFKNNEWRPPIHDIPDAQTLVPKQ